MSRWRAAEPAGWLAGLNKYKDNDKNKYNDKYTENDKYKDKYNDKNNDSSR